jgi:hypothetical protein
MLGPFWSIPTELLPSTVAGSAIGVIQLSNLGGALGPSLIGYLETRTGNLTSVFTFLGVGWLVSAIFAIFLQPRRQISRQVQNG